MSTATTHIETEKQLVPALRFKEFEGNWEKFELEKLASKISVGIATEVRPYVSTKEEVPILRNQNIKAGYFDDSSLEYIIPEFDESNKTKRVHKKDVLIVRTGSNMGNACVVPDKFEGSQTFTTLIVRPIITDLNSEFLSYHINYFGLSEIQRLSAGGGKPNLNAGFLKRYRINVGQLVEQQKIASFLSAVDQKIQQLIKKKALLDRYKKGVMQQLFSGQLRFKDEKGKDYPDWEEKRLGEYLIHKSAKNKDLQVPLVLSVSNKKGFISQNEQFDGYEVASKDLSNYKIVNRDDIAYNPSRINVGSIARLINFEKGIVSPMYVVFSLKDDLDKIYFENLYNIHLFKHLIKVGCSGSVRDSLNFDDLCDFEFKFPSIEEQQKIATYLSSIDTKIEAVTNQIIQTQTFKKGLLQQMFV